MAVTGTILLQDGKHMEIIHGFSDQDKETKRFRKIFETPTGFIYKSGKLVTIKEDLEWLPEPWRTKALNWFETGKKGDEQEELSEIEKLKRKIAELEGQQMGKEELKKKEVVAQKKVEKPVVEKPKVKRTFKCKGCGKEFPHPQALGVHKRTDCPKAVERTVEAA